MKKLLLLFAILTVGGLSAQIKSVPYGNYTINEVTYGTFNVVTGEREVEGKRSVEGNFRTHETHLFFKSSDKPSRYHMYVRKQEDTGYDTYVRDFDPFGNRLQIHVSDKSVGFWNMNTGKFRVYMIDKGL